MAIHTISQQRFEALAGYTRIPSVLLVVQEFEWLATDDGRVLGALVWDRIDYDFSWIMLGRDERNRFRAVESNASLPNAQAARAMLQAAMNDAGQQPDEFFHQGDVEGNPTDFFTPVVPEEKLNTNFKILTEGAKYSSARELVASLMPYYDDVDGNFVEQFQTVGFDARLWEIYLFATFTELAFAHSKEVQVPDLLVTSVLGTIGIEATTINPPNDGVVPMVLSKEDFVAYLENYLPIKIARSLKRKLKKKHPYWAEPHMKDVPFVLALQDFHSPGSMRMIVPAATEYIFGYRHSFAGGKKKIEKIAGHKFGKLTERSGFFELPKSENVSAVIINPQGTLNKFARMGYLAGFRDERLKIVRRGVRCNDSNIENPMPTRFFNRVDDPSYSETWVEGMVVLHNPNALIPLDPELLPGARHEFLEPDGNIMSLIPDFHPLYSETKIFSPEENLE
jgi:hypothetical protein